MTRNSINFKSLGIYFYCYINSGYLPTSPNDKSFKYIHPFICPTHFNHFSPFFHFFFLNFPNPLNHSIPFYFFSTIFSNFSNPYTISLNLNHSYHLEISKVKPFLHHFSKSFLNHYKPFQTIFYIPINGMEWAKCPPQTRGHTQAQKSKGRANARSDRHYWAKLIPRGNPLLPVNHRASLQEKNIFGDQNISVQKTLVTDNSIGDQNLVADKN